MGMLYFNHAPIPTVYNGISIMYSHKRETHWLNEFIYMHCYVMNIISNVLIRIQWRDPFGQKLIPSKVKNTLGRESRYCVSIMTLGENHKIQCHTYS